VAFFLSAVGLGALLSISQLFLSRRVAPEALTALGGPPEAYDLGNLGGLGLPAAKQRVVGAGDRVVPAQEHRLGCDGAQELRTQEKEHRAEPESGSRPENSGRPLTREASPPLDRAEGYLKRTLPDHLPTVYRRRGS
jgi:hypothetical protein